MMKMKLFLLRCSIIRLFCLLNFHFVNLALQVSSCFSNYFELKPSQPKLERLKDLLMEYPYHGEEYEQQNIDTIKVLLPI